MYSLLKAVLKALVAPLALVLVVLALCVGRGPSGRAR